MNGLHLSLVTRSHPKMWLRDSNTISPFARSYSIVSTTKWKTFTQRIYLNVFNNRRLCPTHTLSTFYNGNQFVITNIFHYFASIYTPLVDTLYNSTDYQQRFALSLSVIFCHLTFYNFIS